MNRPLPTSSSRRLPVHPMAATPVSPDESDDPTSSSANFRAEILGYRSLLPNEQETHLQRSQSIPIQQKHMKRTPSELQLHDDEELADYRDFCMFSRIVEGISRHQREINDYSVRRETDMCLAHIIGTRNASEEQLKVPAPVDAESWSLQRIIEKSLEADQPDLQEVFAFDL